MVLHQLFIEDLDEGEDISHRNVEHSINELSQELLILEIF